METATTHAFDAKTITKLGSLKIYPAIEALEECLIREALRRTGGKKVDACRLLGVSRNGLDKKLKTAEHIDRIDPQAERRNRVVSEKIRKSRQDRTLRRRLLVL